MKYVDGGICAAKGYKASGTYCGIKKPNVENFDPNVKHKNDICLFTSDVICNAAAVYTQNKVKGAPILVTKANLEKSGNKAIAVIANSKNANTCNADGVEKADKMCELVASELKIPKEQVIVASTGVIGQVLPIEPIIKAVPILAKELDYGKNEEASTAIMTTDTIKKEYAVEFEIGGVKCTLGGMAKGSGMIHPNMATMLSVITTDAKVSHEVLQGMLREIVADSFNMISVDRDTSTNDTVLLLANGLAGNPEITEENEDYKIFKEALFEVNKTQAMHIAGDGEGATALFEVKVIHADNKEDAKTLAKSVITSSLTKAALFGHDANWGRILCALGYSGAKFDPEAIELYLESSAGKILIFKDGMAADYSEEEATRILSCSEVTALVDMKMGEAEATAWGCDLTYDYVKINADYRS